jgi:hypothetical protein
MFHKHFMEKPSVKKIQQKRDFIKNIFLGLNLPQRKETNSENRAAPVLSSSTSSFSTCLAGSRAAAWKPIWTPFPAKRTPPEIEIRFLYFKLRLCSSHIPFLAVFILEIKTYTKGYKLRLALKYSLAFLPNLTGTHRNRTQV